jgi:hypothetical protein
LSAQAESLHARTPPAPDQVRGLIRADAVASNDTMVSARPWRALAGATASPGVAKQPRRGSSRGIGACIVHHRHRDNGRLLRCSKKKAPAEADAG